MKNTKTILGSSAAIVAAAALIAGGTFAAWSDFDTIEGNRAAAGTLTIDLDDEMNVPIDGQRLAPGENRSKDIFIANRSDETVDIQDAALTVAIEDLTDYDTECNSNTEKPQEIANGVPADERCGEGQGAGQFSEQSYVAIRWNKATSADQCPLSPGSASTANRGTLAALAAAGPRSIGALNPGEGMCVTLYTTLDATGDDAADNAVQGDYATFDLRFELTQILD